MTFTAVQNGGAPVAQTITVSATGGTFGTDGTVLLSTEVSGGAVQSATITNCSGSTCSLVVVVTGALPPGTYVGQVTVRGCSGFNCVTQVGTPKTLTVTLTVTSGATLTSPSAITIFAAPNAAPVAQLLLVQSTDAAAKWIASVAYEAGTPGWLAPIANGTGSQQAVLQVSAMPVGSYRARITFHPSFGGIDTSTIVALSVRESRVTFVSPYIAVASQAGRVRIRGSGFNALGAAQVMFGATAGANPSLESDTEIAVDAPALPVGRYAVAVSAGGGMPPLPGSPELVVVAAPAFGYAAIARTGGVSPLRANQVIYDAERKKIFLYDPDSPTLPGSPMPPSPGAPGQRIERYRFDNGTWIFDEPLAFPLFGGGDVPFSSSTIALTPDGRELLRTGQTTVTRFDPAQISPAVPLETIDARNALGPEIKLMGAAMANDGSLVGPSYRAILGVLQHSAYRYDALERAFYLLATPTGSWLNANFGVGLPTPSGRTVALVNAGAGLPPPRFDYSASTGTIDQVPGTGAYFPRVWSMSRDESILVLAYDPSFSPLLEVRMPSWQVPGTRTTVFLQYDVGAAAVAPDGKRLYYYANNDGKVHALDLEHPGPLVGTDIFPELAAATVPDSPGAGAQMLITPDGGNLIIAGKDRVIVMPAP